MKLFRTIVVFAASMPLVSAANKEMIELQRDMVTLQEQVRQMNDKLVALTIMVQSSLDNTKQSNVSILSMQEKMNESLKQQEKGVLQPVLGVSTRLDQMSDDFRGVKESVLDMNSRLNKLDAKITDLQAAVQIINKPPEPPPPAVPVPDAAATQPTGPPPGMKADTSYTNAYRDYTAGNYDLALQEFTDFLKYFATAQFAPSAQYYVGDIYYKRKDYDNAIVAFDAVLEHYSDGPKTSDAHLMKGKSLLALNKRDAAAKEFKEVVTRYPDSDAAAKAKALLKELGLSSSSPKKPVKKR